jgi:hypothetical protein
MRTIVFWNMATCSSVDESNFPRNSFTLKMKKEILLTLSYLLSSYKTSQFQNNKIGLHRYGKYLTKGAWGSVVIKALCC